MDNSYESIFAGLFCSNLMTVKHLTEVHNIKFHPVSYHDLKDDPDGEMDKIRAFCGIRQDRRCRLPERDTQANSGLSRKTLNPYKIDLKPEEIAKLDRALSATGFPVSGQFPREGETFSKLIGFSL